MTPILKEHRAFLKEGGFFENSKAFIKISGPDRVDFLHRITSQDIKNLISGHGQNGALLDPGGLIISLFEIYNCGQFFLLTLDHVQLQSCMENLERLHFSEDLEIQDASSEFHYISGQGKFLLKTSLEKVFGKLPRRGEILGVEDALIGFMPDFESQILGYHFFVKKSSLDDIKPKLQKTSIPFLSLELWNLLRVETGHFQFGQDITEKNMILEGALEGFVARDKGCYPGQEVVERVFTYGSIAKKLMGLKLSSSEIEIGNKRLKLLQGQDDAGYVTSIHKIPWSQQTIAFGIVRKPRYEVGEKLQIENSLVQAEVTGLPRLFEIKKNQ